nr:endonuclease [Muribaculaceae bacterium]
MLLRWSRQDPVSQKEILRNDAVEKSQGNRNPFVDFPELAEYIWGTRTREVFHIADQDGSQTPPITGPAEITLPVNNETLDFGQVAVTATGTSWLVIKGKNLTSPLSVRIGGTDKEAFTLSTSSIPASNINMTGEYMLTILYTPCDTGTHTATLSLYDGGLNGSIRINLRGEGCPVPTLSPLVATAATDINDRSYIAHWNAAPEVVDFYIVTRTRFTPGDEETDDLEADTNSLLIEGRDPAVMETYYVRSSRLGYLSEASNTITVQATGINNLSDDTDTVIIAPVDEGFVVLASEHSSGYDTGRIIIYDTTGAVTAIIDRPARGEVITLPAGMYIVTGSNVRYPRKIIVR